MKTSTPFLLSTIVIGSLILGGCVAGIGGDAEPSAEPDAVTQVETTPEAATLEMDLAAVEGTYTIDPAESVVGWTASKKVVDTRHTGTIEIESGSITVSTLETSEADQSQMVTGEVVMDMSTIVVTDLEGRMKENLETHLNSSDFFDTASFERATYTIESATPTEVEGVYEIAGTMTIKDISQPVSMEATILEASADRLLLNAVAELDRTLWDVNFGSETIFGQLGDAAIEDIFTIEMVILATQS